jgi:hypothetical protein
MKRILGFSAGGTGREGNVDSMVRAILEKSGGETEFVKLSDLSYSACKGCVQLCARPQVCVLEDDLFPHYQAIKEADAVVIGAPVYFDAINAMAVSFLERFFGYRHVDIPIEGKPFVLAVSGSMQIEAAEAQLRRTVQDFFRVDVIDVVRFRSQCVPCLRCGRHRECRIGGLYAMLGEQALETTITPDMFKRWEDDPDTVAGVERAAEALRRI